MTHNLFESELSVKVSPQLLELHGCFGMVPTKVVESGQTWKWSSWLDVSSHMSWRECQLPSSDLKRQFASGGNRLSRSESDRPSSNCL